MSQNNISRNAQYTDLDLFFTKKTVGNDVNKVTDIQAVKRSLRNLMNLNILKNHFIQRYLVVFEICCSNL